MTTLDLITRTKIQKRVENIVITMCDEDGFINFSEVEKIITSEFGEIAISEAKKQYDFMFGF